MALLQDVSKPGSDIDQYVKGLNSILEHKTEIISALRSRLLGFYYHLRQEEELSNKFNERQVVVNGQNEVETSAKPTTDEETDLLKDDLRLDDFDNSPLN